MNDEEIRSEAKKIMDNFMNSLRNINIDDEFTLERDLSYRKEKDVEMNEDNEFKNDFLANAHRTSGDAILANKGEWVSKK